MKSNLSSLRGRIRWDLAIMVASACLLFSLSIIFQDKGEKAMDISWAFFKEMAFILPAVLVLMGLFGVWVDRRLVIRYLGEGSGIGGLLLAIVLGTLPTGPLYIAFPLAGMLLKKGARVANVILFLSAWACIKIPQELVELRFLGWRFTALRLGLTIALLVPMALLAEVVFHRHEQESALSPGGDEMNSGEGTPGAKATGSAAEGAS